MASDLTSTLLQAGEAASAGTSPTIRGATAAAALPVLDADKLVCYGVALELQALCGILVPASHRVLQDLPLGCLQHRRGRWPSLTQGQAALLDDG